MLSKDYKNHELHKFLEIVEEFYNNLSYGIYSWGSIGINSILNIDTYFFSSLKGTIRSIKNVIKNGQINDGYTLLRKYYDSVIINTYASLYLINNLKDEVVIVDKINSWVKGEEKLPRYKTMNEYVKKSNILKNINVILYKNDKYNSIRKRCNNHMHFNFYRYAFLNDDEINLENRVEFLSQFKNDICAIFIHQ